MPSIFASLPKWHRTKAGFLVFALIELGLSYGLASLAVNSGALWQYLLALILLIGCLQNLAKLIKSIIHGKHKSAEAWRYQG